MPNEDMFLRVQIGNLSLIHRMRNEYSSKILLTGLVINIFNDIITIDDGTGICKCHIGNNLDEMSKMAMGLLSFDNCFLADVFIHSNPFQNLSDGSPVFPIINLIHLSDPNFESLRILQCIEASKLYISDSRFGSRNESTILSTNHGEEATQTSSYNPSLATTSLNSDVVYQIIANCANGFISLSEIATALQCSDVTQIKSIVQELQLSACIYQLPNGLYSTL